MQRCHVCQRDVPEGALYCPFCREAVLPPVSKRHDPFIGRTVDGIYLIQSKIGAGGMGQVYKAVQTNLDRPVAIKILHAALASDESIVERFHLEARSASKLHHPNVIGIIGFGKMEDGTLFMVMEFVPGRNLATVLAEEFPLGERRAVYLTTQILGALSAAHAANIVHRDIKPENILVVSRDNEPDFVKVLDFGIAKIQEGDSQHPITQMGAINGTPAFMSPEQISQMPLDARSDLYSAGIVLYEMLTSRRPFGGNTPRDMFRQHLYETPPPMAERMPAGCRVSPSLEAVVRRALEKKPEDRFPTADAMRQALLECELESELEKPPASNVSNGREMVLNVALAAARASTPRHSLPATLPPPDRPDASVGERIPTALMVEAVEVVPAGAQAVATPRKSRIGLIAIGAGSCLAFAVGTAHLAIRHKNRLPSSTIVETPGAVSRLTDQVEPRSGEQPEERRAKLLAVTEQGATPECEASPGFHDGSGISQRSSPAPRDSRALDSSTDRAGSQHFEQSQERRAKVLVVAEQGVTPKRNASSGFHDGSGISQRSSPAPRDSSALNSVTDRVGSQHHEQPQERRAKVLVATEQGVIASQGFYDEHRTGQRSSPGPRDSRASNSLTDRVGLQNSEQPQERRAKVPVLVVTEQGVATTEYETIPQFHGGSGTVQRSSVNHTRSRPSRELAAEAFNRGVGLFGEKKYKDAIILFQNTLDFDPTYAEAHLYLGASYAFVGDSRKGAWHYEEFAHLAPNHRNTPKAISVLREFYAKSGGIRPRYPLPP